MIEDRFYARWSYERLLLMQPHVHVDGLWKKDERFYAVCPDLSKGLTVAEGTPLVRWFERSGRAMGSPISLVSVVPPGAKKLPERTATELAELKGAPLSERDLDIQLALSLPRNFPKYSYEVKAWIVHVHVSRQLTSEEEQTLRNTFEKLGWPNVTIQVNPSLLTVQRGTNFRVSGVGDIDLLPSQFLGPSISKALRDKWEEDEDFWIADRVKILATTNLHEPNDILPESFKSKGSKCLLNATVFPGKNIRTYLSLFRHVIIAMPLESHYLSMLSAFCSTEDELIELARRGRLQFILPQSIDRYPQRLLERLADVAPDTLLFSRRLGAATIIDGRRRIPLLYPPLGTRDRRLLLEKMIGADRPSSQSAFVKDITVEFSRIWSSTERLVNFRGAMATSALGIGSIVAAIYKYAKGKDVFLELLNAASSVEWGGLLKATVFPTEINDYSEQAATELVASAYSGIGKKNIPTTFGDVEAILNGLLAVDNDAPLLDFEQIFSNSDTDRLGELISKISEKRFDKDSLKSTVAKFNSKVKAYEKKADHLKRLDLIGLAGGVLAAAAPVEKPEKIFISVGTWLLKRLLSDMEGGPAIDWLRATNAWTTRDVVLVSRLNRKLS